MTISEAIEQLDALCYNTYSRGEKVRWLSQADGVAWALVLEPLGLGEAFSGYGPDTPDSQVLLMEPPFDGAYPYLLESQIHYYNGEQDKYNNAMALGMAFFRGWGDRKHRAHIRENRGRRFRF